jgi:hypothetical protein
MDAMNGLRHFAAKLARAAFLLLPVVAIAQNPSKAAFSSVAVPAPSRPFRFSHFLTRYLGPLNQSGSSDWPSWNWEQDLPQGFSELATTPPAGGSSQEVVSVRPPVQQHSQELVQVMPRIGER